jgi:DNA polymerase sigma
MFTTLFMVNFFFIKYDYYVISFVQVPIIKFTDRETAIAFDITFDVQSSGQSVEWVKAELALRPALRPLTMFLKYFLYSRNLHETYHGGVGSFAILVMALSHLQLGVGRTSEKRSVRHVDREYCLGALLVSFFQFYGKTLNYVRVGLSVRDGGSMFLKTSRDWLDPRRPFLLSIENPFETDLDVGKNSFNIMRVRKAFEWAYDTLLLSNAYESDAPTLLSRIVHVNEVIYANRPARPRTEIPTSVQTAATAVDLTKDDAVVDVNSDEPQVSPAVDNKRKKKRRSKEPIDLTVDDEDGDSSENDGQPSKRSIKRKKWADKHRFQQ